MTMLDGLQKDLMRFEKLAEYQHAPHHAVHAAHDHDHRRRETWWLAADGSHGHPGSSETLHKCPQVILGLCQPPLHPQPLPTSPRSPISMILGMTTTSGPYLRAADLSDLGKGVSALTPRLLHLFTNGLVCATARTK